MKRIISLVLIILAMFSISLPVSASELEYQVESVVGEEDNEVMHEVTQWYFRRINNILEKRLWSVTFGYWKTDWIPVF